MCVCINVLPVEYVTCHFRVVLYLNQIEILLNVKMIKLTQDIDLENYTLILPSVAVGNVGQLAVDLLISNLNLSKIGQIFSASFIPVVGANAYHEHSNELITAIDIYAGTKERIVVIQIRSPYVDDLTEFFSELAQFVTERKIAKVIFYSTVSAVS